MTPTQRRWLRRVPALLAALVLLVLLARNADVPSLPDYEVPEGFTPAPPPEPEAAGGVRPALAGVPGTTTTTVPANVGRARLAGSVVGPSGPVPGATVRIERVLGDAVQVLDVAAGPDGRYEAAGIGGGRYRVRAFLPPTFAQPAGEVLFLRDGDDHPLDLRVDAFGDARIAVAHAPEAPLLGDPVNVAVRVSAGVVDADGTASAEPVVGATVEVAASGGLGPTSPLPEATGADGVVELAFRCASTAPTTLQVRVRLPGAVPGTAPATATAQVPACVDPATLTTTTTTTPVDGGEDDPAATPTTAG